jgi:hypothetical protein
VFAAVPARPSRLTARRVEGLSAVAAQQQNQARPVGDAELLIRAVQQESHGMYRLAQSFGRLTSR